MQKEVMTKAKNLLENGLVAQDNENSWTVDDEIVLEKTQDGYSYLSCSCNSCTFSLNKGLCHRKIAVILFQGTLFLQMKLNGTIKKFEPSEKLNMPIDTSLVIQSLKDLRGLG